jgi:hypothetical protein
MSSWRTRPFVAWPLPRPPGPARVNGTRSRSGARQPPASLRGFERSAALDGTRSREGRVTGASRKCDKRSPRTRRNRLSRFRPPPIRAPPAFPGRSRRLRPDQKKVLPPAEPKLLRWQNFRRADLTFVHQSRRLSPSGYGLRDWLRSTRVPYSTQDAIYGSSSEDSRGVRSFICKISRSLQPFLFSTFPQSIFQPVDNRPGV